jgi:outer membrane lipoprotein carrier protein
MRLLISIVALIALGTATAADTARSRMEAFSKDLKSVTADFTQTVTDANGGRGDASRGTMALEDLSQVSVRSQSGEEAHSPLTVLTDLSQLDSEFTASESGERDGFAWLKLVSKAKEPEFEYAELGFSGDSLERMLFRDQLGNTTEIDFSNWRRNPKIDPSQFKFTPPKGVDVIGSMDPGAEIHPIRD